MAKTDIDTPRNQWFLLASWVVLALLIVYSV